MLSGLKALWGTGGFNTPSAAVGAAAGGAAGAVVGAGQGAPS